MYVSRHFAKHAEVRAVAAVTAAMDDLEEPLGERRTRLLAWANASVSQGSDNTPEPRPSSHVPAQRLRDRFAPE
jgi:hypothetical protein